MNGVGLVEESHSLPTLLLSLGLMFKASFNSQWGFGVSIITLVMSISLIYMRYVAVFCVQAYLLSGS